MHFLLKYDTAKERRFPEKQWKGMLRVVANITVAPGMPPEWPFQWHITATLATIWNLVQRVDWSHPIVSCQAPFFLCF